MVGRPLPTRFPGSSAVEILYVEDKSVKSRLIHSGCIALVLIFLEGPPARAGKAFYSHSIDLPPKVEATNIAIYEHDMAMYNRNPVAFDHHHPLIGRILSDPA